MLADGARLGPSVQAEAQKAGDAGGQTLAKAMGERLRANAGRIFAGIGAGIGTFIAGSTQEFAKFDDAMRQVFSIMPGISKAAMDKMKDDVLGVSREFGILTDDLIPALGTAIGSGIPEQNVMEFLRVAAKAAKAGATDAETSVKALSATINAFHIPVEKANEVADSFFNAIDKGVTTFPELAASMSDVAPAAAAMGLSLEDVLAAVTAMTLQGTSTSSAITNVQASLTALQRTTPAMEKALKNLGFATGQAMLDTLGYQGTMEALRKEAEKMGVPLIDLTGRLEGTSAILQLTGENAAKSQEILGTFGDTTGKVDAAFKVMEGGIGGTTRRMLATIKSWAIGVGKEFEALGPLFVLFGPTAGRAIGAGLGAAFGAVTPILATGLKMLGLKLVASIIAWTVPASIAGTAVGTAAGTAAGTAFTVAAAAAIVAAPLVVLAVGLHIRGELDQQGEDLKAQTAEFVKTVSDEDLAKAIEGVREQFDGMVGSSMGAKTKVADVLNLLIAESNKRAHGVPQIVSAALREGGPAVTAGATTMVGGMDTAWVKAARQAGYGARRVSQSFYDNITAKQGVVQQALADLVTLQENTMDKAAEIAYLTGVLTSKALADGLNDKRADVREQAERTRMEAEDRLAELRPKAGNIGKQTNEALAKGLKDKDPDVRAQAERTAGIIKREIKNTKARAAGRTAGVNVAKGLASSGTAIGAAAIRLGRRIVTSMLAGISSTNVTNSARYGGHEVLAHGGTARAGVPYIVGENRPELFVPNVTGHVFPSIGEGMAAIGATTGGDTFNVNLLDRMEAHGVGDIASATKMLRRRGYFG